jgi:GTP cyclohydrolase I
LERQEISQIISRLLNALGEDPEREGLKKTPERVARMYEELLIGYRTSPDDLLNGAIFTSDYNEMVILRNIDFYSLCEHHLLPFFGVAHVAYIPNGKIIGLSKLARIVEFFSRRLQVQERMTMEIAHFLKEKLQPLGVGVVVSGMHLCMIMRGVKKSNARMITSAMLGVFRDDPRTRLEFLNLIGHSGEE